MNSGRVLVLNQDYSPLTICSISRAFLLVFLNKADLLEKMDGVGIRTVRKTYDMPAVIRIKNFINLPYRGVVLTRHNVFRRDNNQCQYCGTDRELTLDHLLPRSKGGKSTWKNLVTACKNCNAHKGDQTLEQAGLVLQRPPFKPTYVMFLKDTFGHVRKEWIQYLNPTAVVA